MKSDNISGKCAVYSIIGVNREGRKDCFGFWIGENEGAHQWLGIFDELKARGVEKLGFVCIDGLAGLGRGNHKHLSECHCLPLYGAFGT